MGSENPRTPILIVVPVFQAVYADPFQQFLGIMLHAAHACGDRYRFDVKVYKREALTTAMNLAGKLLKEHDHAAMIVFDDDCLPPVDCIPRLLKHYEAGHVYVAGAGVMRQSPYTTTAGRYYKSGPTLVQDGGEMAFRGFHWIDDLTNAPPLMEVDFCGVPVALIARSVFERAKYPWFATHDETGEMTHDVFFARRVQSLGEKVYVDTTIRCGHLGDAPVVTFEARGMARDYLKTLQAKGVA